MVVTMQLEIEAVFERIGGEAPSSLDAVKSP